MDERLPREPSRGPLRLALAGTRGRELAAREPGASRPGRLPRQARLRGGGPPLVPRRQDCGKPRSKKEVFSVVSAARSACPARCRQSLPRSGSQAAPAVVQAGAEPMETVRRHAPGLLIAWRRRDAAALHRALVFWEVAVPR